MTSAPGVNEYQTVLAMMPQGAGLVRFGRCVHRAATIGERQRGDRDGVGEIVVKRLCGGGHVKGEDPAIGLKPPTWNEDRRSGRGGERDPRLVPSPV